MMNDLLLKMSKVIVCIFAGFICGYLFLNSIFSTCVMWYDNEQTYYIKDFPILLLGGLFIFIILLVFNKKYLLTILKNEKALIISATGIWTILLTIFVINTDIRLVYDQASVYEGIVDFLNGDYTSWAKGGYYYNFNFQNGLAFMYAPIMLIFGENTYWAVQGVNAICYFMLAVGMYKITKEYFNKYVAVCSYLMILFYVPLWGYVKYFYGSLSGMCFGIWSMYFIVLFVKEQRWKWLLSGSVCTLFTMIFKGNFLIYVLAICLLLAIEAIRKKEWNYLIAIVAIIVAAKLGMSGPSYVMHCITGEVTNQGIPAIKSVVVGLRESYVAPGWYNGNAPEWFAKNGYSVEAASKSAWKSIGESMNLFLQEKEYALRFFCRKLASIWNNPTFEGFAVVVKGNGDGTLAYWMKDILYSGGVINTVITLVLDVVHTMILFGVLLYLALCMKDFQIREALLMICFIGGYLLHIFWEAKCQYTILFFILLFPYVFMGYQQCIKECENVWRNRNLFKKAYQKRGVWFIGVILALTLVIGLSNSEFWTSTIKLQGGESEYIWLCKEHADWKSDTFTKEGK